MTKTIDWIVVNDNVMGGKSTSSFALNNDGHGAFKGHVSLENNGGFSMVRHQFSKKETITFSKIVLYLKGDGKNYQFRIKTRASDSFSYIANFKTNENWQYVEIPLENMVPTYRGRKLEQPNFNNTHIEEIAFFIGNKQEEYFTLLLDKISLK